jgi:hypothetical protein
LYSGIVLHGNKSIPTKFEPIQFTQIFFEKVPPPLFLESGYATAYTVKTKNKFQAFLGDINEEEPPKDDILKHRKYEAWKQFKGLSQVIKKCYS